MSFKDEFLDKYVQSHWIILPLSVKFAGTVLSLRLRIPVPREKEALLSTWLSWTSSASSPLNWWDKTRGLCKFSPTHAFKPQDDFCKGLQFPNITGVPDNCRNWCFRCMSGVDRTPPVGMHTCLRVLTFAPSVRECCSRLRFSHFSPATCTSSASWRSRWPCSGRTAGSHSSRTGILYRLAVMTIPCQWWVATPAEDPPFVPRRQKLPLVQLEPRPPRGSCQKVFRKHAANAPSVHLSQVALVGL